jgi:MarR family transcriptional regulator for hemolysin|nr:MarR family transcriptional regulator [uncultured Pseudoxanthomonas sp.]
MKTPAGKSTIGYLIADLSRLFGRVFDRRAAHLGLTRVQWRALKRIHQSEGITQSELADLLDMEPIAVGRVIDRLQKAGFVERRSDPDDRRVWRLHLLPQSDAVMHDIEAVATSVREDCLAGVDPDELVTAMKVLGQVRENLSLLDRASRAESSLRKS